MERGDGHEKNAQKAHEGAKRPGICTWLCAWITWLCYWLCRCVLHCVYAICCCKPYNVDGARDRYNVDGVPRVEAAIDECFQSPSDAFVTVATLPVLERQVQDAALLPEGLLPLEVGPVPHVQTDMPGRSNYTRRARQFRIRGARVGGGGG